MLVVIIPRGHDDGRSGILSWQERQALIPGRRYWIIGWHKDASMALGLTRFLGEGRSTYERSDRVIGTWYRWAMTGIARTWIARRCLDASDTGCRNWPRGPVLRGDVRAVRAPLLYIRIQDGKVRQVRRESGSGAFRMIRSECG